MTSPVKLVAKIRRGRLANPKWWRQAKNATSAKILEEMSKASEIEWDSLINLCHQIHRVVGEFSFKESMVEKLTVDGSCLSGMSLSMLNFVKDLPSN